MKKIKITLLILTIFSSLTIAYSQKLTQKEKWELKLQNYARKDSIQPPTRNNILFIGSSTVENWKTMEKDFAQYHVINRGVSGTKMIDLYNFRERLILPYQPKKIFIYEGDNDIALKWSADSIVHVFKELFNYIRTEKPSAKIYVVSIKPSPSREKYKDVLLKTNELLKAFISTQENAEYIDIYNPMLKDGNLVDEYYRSDKLHLTPAGYDIWKKVFAPYFQ